MKRMLKQLMGALCVLLLASQAWAGASGYSSTAVGPTVYTKGYWYSAGFAPVGYIPPGSKIGAWVNWSYSMSYRPAGFLAILCYDSTCGKYIDITNQQSGSTTYFNNMAAGNTFVIKQGVQGSGALSPVMYGNMDQVIVNFTY